MTRRSLADLESRAGETKRTVEGFGVEAGKVEEFARAVGDDDPVYRSADAAAGRGLPAIPAPLTFPRVSSFARYRVGRFDLGFDPKFVLHGEQRYEYERPLYVGDVLRGDTTLTDVYRRDGRRGGPMTFAEFATEYRTADGECVLTEHATAIETDGAANEDAEGRETERSSGRVDGERFANPSPASGTDGAETADDLVGLPVGAGLGGDPEAPDPTDPPSLADGDVGPEVTVGPFARQHFVRYAGASGDFNPVHYDEPYAAGAGHPGVFGQGMLTAGVAAQAVADFVGVDRVRSFAVRFQSRVWPGDTVTAQASVADAPDAAGTDTPDGVALDVAVERDDGETVLTGTATVTTDS